MHLNSFFVLLNKNHEPSSEQHADELIVNDNSFKVTFLLSSVTGVSSNEKLFRVVLYFLTLGHILVVYVNMCLINILAFVLSILSNNHN